MSCKNIAYFRGDIKAINVFFRYGGFPFQGDESGHNDIQKNKRETVENEMRDEWILKNINLRIGKGEFVALIGANGSGKSTLLKILNGLLTPNKGRVLVNGLDTSDDDKIGLIRQQIQMVFQVPETQIVGTTVEEDLAFGPENLGLSYEEIKNRIDEAAVKVGIDYLRKRDTHTLSGGQKQMLAIASVITLKPEWLLLDEPTSMLDPDSKKGVLNLILDFWREGMGIVLATQSMEEAIMAERIIVLKEGMVLKDGSPEEVFSGNEIFQSNLELPEILDLTGRLRQFWPDLREFYRDKHELMGDVLRKVKKARTS